MAVYKNRFAQTSVAMLYHHGFKLVSIGFFMQNKEIFYKLPLNAQTTDAHRILLEGTYYSVESALLFENQIKSLEEAKDYLENAILEFKLVRFEDQFRSKMFEALKGKKSEDQESLSNGIMISVRVNIFQKKIIHIEEYAKTFTGSLEKLISGNLAIHLEQPFYSLFPSLLNKQELEENHKKLKKQKKLVPFQSVYPFCASIHGLIKDNQEAILDDLYCTNPMCDCNEVACIAISFDPVSGNEIVHGGFKYHLEKKAFKMMTDFPTNYNAQVWLKKFSENHFINLPFLFKSRYDFLRSSVKEKR